jgi:PAS domain S-box-containing protein
MSDMWRSLFDASPLAIISVDREGCVQLWNHAAEKIFGWHQQEVLGHLLPIILPEDLPQFRQELLDLLNGTAYLEMERVRRDKAGRVIPVRVSAAPLYDRAGQGIGTLNIMADLTEAYRDRADSRTIKTHLTTLRDADHRRLAQALHDEVLQQLVGLQLQLVHLRSLLTPITSEGIKQVEGGMEAVGNQMAVMIRFLRRITAEMNPPGLEAFGLKPSLDALAKEWQQNSQLSDTTLELILPTTDLELPLSVATVVLRVAEGALQNIRRHATAQHVILKLVQAPTQLSLVVHDDGKGFQAPTRLSELARQGHFGILGMADQIESVGGTFSVIATPEKGTLLTATIPITVNT